MSGHGMNPSTAAARALLDSLIAQGVRHVVISPGSRSAPIAYALARAVELGLVEAHVRVDERVAAFTALGLARFGPAAVVTTSGTAAANLHPALMEARHSRVGLIAITADRPHEMRGVGANQTTDQMHMFGPHIHAVEFPAGASPAAISNQVRRIGARVRGVFAPREPVHLNIAFRDPLVPEEAHAVPPPAPERMDTHLRVDRSAPEPVTIDTARPSVVVAGDGAGWAAARFAQEAGLPLLAEPSSGARAGATAIGPYQRLLADLGGQVAQVVVFGRPTLSRPVANLLAAAPHVTVVADSPEWVDLTGRAEQVVGAVRVDPAAPGSDPQWLERWREREQLEVERTPRGFAPAVVARVLGAGQPQVMIGSSMAIRYADIHGPVGSAHTREPVFAARGLAGIDGTISTATGIALASGPTRVVVGDLTFAHDVGALALGPHERVVDLQVVVLNDSGGAIFAHLEHGEPRYSGVFDRFFATPLHLDLEALAAAYGFDYRRLSTPEQIDTDLPERFTGRSIVEVTLPPV